MIRVKATREGLDGRRMASGIRVHKDLPFVALPSTAALRMWIRIHNPANQHVVRALVLDVGPWNEKDHAYVFQPATMDHLGLHIPPPDRTVRPHAETGTDQFGRPTNGAGIDLGELVWHALGMTDNSEVDWEFD